MAAHSHDCVSYFQCAELMLPRPVRAKPLLVASVSTIVFSKPHCKQMVSDTRLDRKRVMWNVKCRGMYRNRISGGGRDWVGGLDHGWG